MSKKPKSKPPADNDKNGSKKASSQNKIQEKAYSINLWNTGAILLSLIAGFIHYKYLWTLFENERHFSHLATIERDISFRTEQGLYYSYYKSIINAPSFNSGLNDVLQDTVTEHPSTFNVLKRFNLWPEVVAAASYRLFVKNLAEGFFKKKTKECWMVNRGDGKSQVHSCEGWGDEHYFYVNLVFLLNGFVLVGGIFYLSTSVSKSYLGGMVSVILYFFNHGECTRCMWTPPLREQWSFPFLPMQVYMVTKILAEEKTRLSDTLKLTFFTSIFMVSWQFSQFALFTQTASIMVIYLLEICNSDQVKSILKAQLFSILLNFFIQFGNEMLLTSFGFSSILVAFVIVEVKSKLQLTNFKVLPIFKVLFGLIPWFAGTYGLKGTITRLFGVQDDAHIFDILVSKFSNFATFHTKLYTCAPEFDFLPIATFQVFVGTGLLFFVVALVTAYAYRTIKYSFGLDVERIPADELYIVVQSCAYTLVAILIMRLKLFMSPLFCILSCLVVKHGVFSDDEKVIRRWKILFFGILTFGAFGMQSFGFQGGLANINNELMKVGNFENIPQEDMLEWVIANTVKEGEGKAVFAGPMPIMATMKHVAERSIVNHPHYENQEIRDRTFSVYTVFSRRPIKSVHAELKNLGVTHLIYEHGWCARRGKAGCSMPELYDFTDVEFRDKKTHCDDFQSGKVSKKYFKLAYKNPRYRIFNVV